MQISEAQAVDNEVGNGDVMLLVDNFVQGIIERAKQEYIGSWATVGVETRVREENEEDRVHAGNLLRVTSLRH